MSSGEAAQLAAWQLPHDMPGKSEAPLHKSEHGSLLSILEQFHKQASVHWPIKDGSSNGVIPPISSVGSLASSSLLYGLNTSGPLSLGGE
jgi:hypothetical protein